MALSQNYWSQKIIKHKTGNCLAKWAPTIVINGRKQMDNWGCFTPVSGVMSPYSLLITSFLYSKLINLQGVLTPRWHHKRSLRMECTIARAQRFSCPRSMNRRGSATRVGSCNLNGNQCIDWSLSFFGGGRINKSLLILDLSLTSLDGLAFCFDAHH